MHHRVVALTALAAALIGVIVVGKTAAQSLRSVSEHGTVTRVERGVRSVPNPLRHVPDEVLVKLRPGLAPAPAARALTAVPLRSTRRFRSVEHLYHVKLASGVSLPQALS